MFHTAIYTGTFDPLHQGHIWALQQAFKSGQFKQAIIAVNQGSPKKLAATDVKHRLALARLQVGASKLPFRVEVMALPYGTFDSLVDKYKSAGPVTRIIGSDSVASYIQNDQAMWSHLLACHNTIVVRTHLADGSILDEAIQSLPNDIKAKLSYDVVATIQKPIEARRMRKNIHESYKAKLISKPSYEYIQAHGLYPTDN